MAASALQRQYDFDRFAEETPNEETKPKIRRHSQSPAKRGSLAFAVVFSVAAVGLLSLPILSAAKLTEISRQIATENNRLDELMSENVRMKTDIESKSTIKSVQDYAENVLGMQKLDKSQIEYVDTENGSEVEIPDYNPGFFTRISNKFWEFVEYIGG
jgi:hypothetical protein